LVQDLLDGLDDIGGSKVSESLEENNGVVDVLSGLASKTFLQLLDKLGSELLGDKLLVAEFSVESDGVAGVLDLLVDAGLVSEGGESQQSTGANLFLALHLLFINKVPDLFKELLGGGTDVHGELRNDLSSLFTLQFTRLDELAQELDSGVGTGDGQDLSGDVLGNLVLLLLASRLLLSLVLLLLGLSISNLELGSKLLDLLVVQLTGSLDGAGDLGDGFALGDGVSRGFGGLDQITGDLLDQLSGTVLGLAAGNGGDEEGAQWSLVHGGLAELTLRLTLSSAVLVGYFLAGFGARLTGGLTAGFLGRGRRRGGGGRRASFLRERALKAGSTRLFPPHFAAAALAARFVAAAVA